VAEPTLELAGVEVRYGSVPAVRSLSFSVERGGLVGLIGANGAGKSSTLHAIMGVVPVRAGDIRVSGRSVVGLPPEEIVRRGVSLVPEGRRIFSGLTVEDNLRLGFVGRGARNGRRRAALDWIYELFPIVREFRARQAGALSGGQQQQLAIARALVSEPDVLLLDEPSLGLAPTLVDLVFSALETVRRRGVTVLLVEQRAQRTVALADRTLVLANGELRLTLTPADAGDSERIVKAYFSS